MNEIHSIQSRFIIPLASLLFLAPASGSVLMLDFGPDTVLSAQAQNSPYHTRNPLFTDATWNSRGTVDVASGLFYSDGLSATGVAYNLGAGSASTTIDLGIAPNGSSSLGGTQNSGPYADRAPGRDGIFHGSSGTPTHLGIQITGLSPGIYEVFVATRNTNASQTYNMTTYLGVGTAGTNFNFASYQSSELSFVGTTGSTSGWSAEGTTGENYNRFTVTITGEDALNIAVSGSANETRGFLNMIQIVPIPEPSTASIAVIGLLGMFVRRRRAR